MTPKLIAMLQSDKEERLAISLQQYPRLLIDALLLTESFLEYLARQNLSHIHH